MEENMISDDNVGEETSFSIDIFRLKGDDDLTPESYKVIEPGDANRYPGLDELIDEIRKKCNSKRDYSISGGHAFEMNDQKKVVVTVRYNANGGIAFSKIQRIQEDMQQICVLISNVQGKYQVLVKDYERLNSIFQNDEGDKKNKNISDNQISLYSETFNKNSTGYANEGSANKGIAKEVEGIVNNQGGFTVYAQE